MVKLNKEYYQQIKDQTIINYQNSDQVVARATGVDIHFINDELGKLSRAIELWCMGSNKSNNSLMDLGLDIFRNKCRILGIDELDFPNFIMEE
ncbi:MAG: hypothetical protein LBH98_10100 [Chitinispirillales bacterium]|jgi:hypothetical protein|nr:hypothetical protein [Chitinispirillales bacterium]